MKLWRHRVFHYMTPSAAAMLLPIVTLPIMTRWLNPDDYGAVAVAQVVAAAFMGLASLGVSTGVERNFFVYEREPTRLAALMHTAYGLVAAGAVGAALVMLAVGPALSRLLYGDADRAPFLLAMAGASTLGVLATIQLVYFRNRGRARTYMVFNLANLVLETAATLVLVTVMDAGVWSIPLGMLAGKAPIVASGWILIARELPPSLDGRLARELLGIGLPLMPRVMVSVADNGIDRLSLNWLVSLGQAGFFGLANRIGYSVFSLMTSFEQLYVPQVYRVMFEGGADAGARIGRILTPYFYVSILAAGVVVLFVEEVLWVLVAPAFWPIKYAGAVLATYYGQLFFGKVIGAQWIFLKKTWYATPASVARLALHLALTLLLVGPFGALGAAAAVLAAGTIVDGVSLAIAQRQYRIVYELHVVVPMMVLFYASMSWVVLPIVTPVPYGMHLAGRVALFGLMAAAGMKWILPLRGGRTSSPRDVSTLATA